MLSNLIYLISMLRILAAEGDEEDEGDWIPELQQAGA